MAWRWDFATVYFAHSKNLGQTTFLGHLFYLALFLIICFHVWDDSIMLFFERSLGSGQEDKTDTTD